MRRNCETITNQYGLEIDYQAAEIVMDTDVREKLHQEIAPCSAQNFFDEYCIAHAEKFKKVFFLDTPNPVW